MWLIEVIDFLYFRDRVAKIMLFRFLRGLNTRSSIQLMNRSVTRKDLVIVRAFQNLRLLPFFSQRLLSTTTPRFVYTKFVFNETLVTWGITDKTQVTFHNTLTAKPGFLRRRWKWWRSENQNAQSKAFLQPLTSGGGIQFRGGFSYQVPRSQG